MLSYAARYHPTWQVLEERRVAAPQRVDRVLEAGSGAEGLALFWKGSLVGVDLRFKRRPMALGVVGSALHLPFAPASFPVAVSCDMLEHLPAELRRQAVLEMGRVCRERLLVGFPSGAAAEAMYQALAHRWAGAAPPWLEEHLTYGLPGASEVAGWLADAGWQVSIRWYESAAAHARRLEWERRGLQRWISYLAARALGPWWMQRQRLEPPADPLRVLLDATPCTPFS